MGGLFSKKKKDVSRKDQRRAQNAKHISSKDRVVLDLKNARDRLKKYQHSLEKDSVHLHETARALLKAGKKDRAKLTLQMKKYKQVQLEKADGQLFNVLQLVDTIEWETQELQVFNALKEGTETLNGIHQELSVEAVENLMEDTAEAQATANEISQMLGMNSLSEIDDDDVLDELAKIEQEAAHELESKLPQAPESNTTMINSDSIQVETRSDIIESNVPKPERTTTEKKRPILVPS